MNWTEISQDPNDIQAILQVGRHLNSLAKSFTGSKLDLVRRFATDKQVLDIGASGHVPASRIEEWSHHRIKEVSAGIKGIDIDEQSCEYYVGMGYDFTCIDATSEEDLGLRFDFAYCGDIIEHVNDAVALMRFTSRHLRPGGQCLISTPNPYFRGFNQLRVNRGEFFYTPNLQHVSWIVPANMMEIVRRAGGLLLTEIYVPEQAVASTGPDVGGMEQNFHEYIYVLARC